jgi:hypothetical protein
LPHTALAETAIKEKIIADHKDLLFPKFYLSKDLDPVWADATIKAESKKYHRRMAGMLRPVLRNFTKRHGWF